MLAVVVAIGCCQGCHPGPKPVVKPAADAAPTPPAGTATCLDLCRHETALNCPAAAPTPAGATCVDVCINNQNGPAPWDLDCRTSAGGPSPSSDACAAIDRCP